MPGHIDTIPTRQFTLKPSAATVPDVEYLHRFTFDSEQDAIDMRPSAVEQLAQFNW